MSSRIPAPPGLNRQIAALAVPALGALLAEPAFLLADAAIIGHLGTAQLAGQAVASVILTTVVGLSIFLAYATTAQVARFLGAGDRRGALTHGIGGLYLAVAIGVVAGLVLYPLAPWLVTVLGAGPAEAGFSTTYLRWSLPGLPGMLLVLAATGVLRGLQNTRIPLLVAAIGAIANVALNLLLVYGAGLGVAGAAIGTAIAQTGMAAAFVVVVWHGAKRHGARLTPHIAGILGTGRAGIPLLIRTATLRAAIVATTMVAAGLGTAELAGHQIAMTMWNFLALGLDSLAIAAQALTGKALGEGDAAAARHLTRRMVGWGLVAGGVIGVAVFAVHGLVGAGFSPDPQVQRAVMVVLVIVAIAQPLAGYVFVLDGVLIGAGDGTYLAWAGIATLVVYLPVAYLVATFGHDDVSGLVWLWIAYAGVFMASRAVTLGLRYRTNRWLVTGA